MKRVPKRLFPKKWSQLTSRQRGITVSVYFVAILLFGLGIFIHSQGLQEVGITSMILGGGLLAFRAIYL